MKTLKALFHALEVHQNEMKTRYAVSDAIGEAIKVAALETAWEYINRPKKPRTKSGRWLDLNTEEQTAAREGRKIDSIKLYRGRTGLSLKESKDAVEAWMNANGVIVKYSNPW